jgi:hypothetical protein
VDAVERRPDWIDTLGAWAWLFVFLELDFLFWLGVVRGCEALLS